MIRLINHKEQIFLNFQQRVVFLLINYNVVLLRNRGIYVGEKCIPKPKLINPVCAADSYLVMRTYYFSEYKIHATKFSTTLFEN